MKKFLIASAITLVAASHAQAYDRNTIQFGLGEDVLRQDARDDGHSALGTVQWRGKQFNPQALAGIGNISPMVGADLNTDGGGTVYAGFLYDWNVYGGIHIVPNIAVGLYEHGSSKDLGGPIEFHDSIDLQYEIDSVSRVGIELTHMSNASIYDKNPGKEYLEATYSFAYW